MNDREDKQYADIRSRDDEKTLEQLHDKMPISDEKPPVSAVQQAGQWPDFGEESNSDQQERTDSKDDTPEQ